MEHRPSVADERIRRATTATASCPLKFPPRRQPERQRGASEPDNRRCRLGLVLLDAGPRDTQGLRRGKVIQAHVLQPGNEVFRFHRSSPILGPGHRGVSPTPRPSLPPKVVDQGCNPDQDPRGLEETASGLVGHSPSPQVRQRVTVSRFEQDCNDHIWSLRQF